MATITGTEGNDTLTAFSGDLLAGGDGNDVIEVSGGDIPPPVSYLTVYGGAGNDTIASPAASDEGWPVLVDAALLDGGDGDDEIRSAGFYSTINGGDGDDLIVAGDVTGNDETGFGFISGGGGHDRIELHGTGYSISGGAGDDVFALPLTPVFFGFQWSRITDFTPGEDRIDLAMLLEQLAQGYGFAGGDPFASGHLRLLQSELGTELHVNVFGWHPLLVLGGVNGWDALASHGSELFAQPFDLEGYVLDARVNGSNAAETLQGHAGNDTLVGNDGDDSIAGDAAYDELNGGDGNDTLVGGDGNDTLYGSTGDDLLQGGDGNDYLFGGPGMDALHGGAGNDTLFGISGQVLLGEDGDDHLSANGESILCDGGNGNDVIIMRGALEGTGGAGDDRIEALGGAHILMGEGGNDTIRSGHLGDTLSGHDGNDLLSGRRGDDMLDGGLDDDTVFGGAGDDHLIGDEGHDLLVGGVGSDILDGGNGDDRLRGDAGDDHLHGGEGNDLLTGGDGINSLHGDAGRDKFLFRDAFAEGNVSTVTDFVRGEDRILVLKSLTDIDARGTLDATHFRYGTQAQDSDDRFIFDAESGALYYDTDGNGATQQVLFAVIETDGMPFGARDIGLV